MDENKGLQVLRLRHDHKVRIGITGTRSGMTIEQWRKVQQILTNLWKDRGSVNAWNEWHDGDCVGADEQGHGLVETLEHNGMVAFVKLIGHPGKEWHNALRANRVFDKTLAVKPPLARNKDIVDSVDVMIAAPKQYDEQGKGSGTWATIRYANKVKKPLFTVWPDGTATLGNLEKSDVRLVD